MVPDETILIQNPVALVTESESPDKAKAFVDWLRTEQAQQIFAAKGYRSVLPELDKVNAEFFDPEKGSVADIERDLGVSTAG